MRVESDEFVIIEVDGEKRACRVAIECRQNDDVYEAWLDIPGVFGPRPIFADSGLAAVGLAIRVAFRLLDSLNDAGRLLGSDDEADGERHGRSPLLDIFSIFPMSEDEYRKTRHLLRPQDGPKK